MSSNSPAAPKKSGFRKFLGNLKDGFRSSSSSRPASPHLGDRSASSVDLRPQPIALPRSPSQLVVTQPVSLVAPIVGVGVTAPPSADVIPAVTVTEPSAQSASIFEPSAGDKLKQAGKTAWAGLKLALEVLEASSDVFPPLKSAVAGFNACLTIVEDVASIQKDYARMATELQVMVEKVNQYATELSSEDRNGSLAKTTLSIEAAAKQIAEKRTHGKLKRTLESKQDKDDVMECYQKIEAAFRYLQMDADLWTLRKLNRQRELTLLQNMKSEEEARYDSAHGENIQRRGCTAETRERIQIDLQDWVNNPQGAKVFWMNGMAGTGKTTIAFSLCQWLEANKQLGASFFCTRTTESCREVKRIIRTIACQLGRYSSHYRSALCTALENDPGVVELNVVQQFGKLIKGPLLAIKEKIPHGVVVVIDALDECADSHSVRLILETLMKYAADLPLKFFVASRPEHAIIDAMPRPNDSLSAIFHLHNIEDSIVYEDIQKYLKGELEKMTPRPSDYKIEQLAKDSGRLFIYAATVVRYVMPNHAPSGSSARLDTMLATASQATREARPAHKYRDLDALYSTVLEATLAKDLEDGEREPIELVLWTAICAKEPLSIEAICALLNLSKDQVESALKPLRSVLNVSEGEQLISTLHASFPDYMLDGARSGAFFCDKVQHNQRLANDCFDVMKDQLRFNICGLKSSLVFDEDVPDFGGLVKRSISSALSYACRYWGAHLQLGMTSAALAATLHEFISHRLLFWMEVLNVKTCVVMGVSILRQAQDWLQGHELLGSTQRLVADAQHFVTRFAASACKRSTPHIYTSALPFCPKEGSIYKHYWGRTKGLMSAKGTAIDSLAQASISTWKTGSAVICLAIAYDGERIVSGSYDHTIRVWDTRTGEPIAGPFEGHTGSVNSVGFSPDGKHIVSGSDDETIRVWDAQTGELVAGPLQGHTLLVKSVGFSPDGKHIVSGSSDETIRVWDTQHRNLVAGPLEGHTHFVKLVGFSPDGKHIASGSADKTIRVWDAQTGQLVAGPLQGHTHSVNSVGFSPDGKHIVSGSNDETIRVWDAQTGQLVAGPLQGHTGWVKSIGFSPNGKHIVSGSDDQTIRVWDAQTGQLVTGPLRGHTDSVKSVGFSPDGKHVVSGSDDKTIRVWDAQTGELVAGPLQGHTRSVNSVGFSPDGKHTVSGSSDRTICVWDAQTGELVAGPFTGHTGSVNSVGFSPDGKHIVSGSDDQAIRVWLVQTREPFNMLLPEPAGSVNPPVFPYYDSRILCSSADPGNRIVDSNAGISTLQGASASTNLIGWSFQDDGWITLHDQPYLWISPTVRTCFPSPLHPLAIGLQGSISVDTWALLISDRWSECYDSI